MKTINLFYTVILFFFMSSNFAQAQVEVKGTEDILFKLRLNKSIEENRNNTYQDIEGDPFLFADFTMGSIKLIDDGIYNGLLRFDKYAGEIHFKKDDEIYAISFPEKIEYIEMEGMKFIYSDFKLSPSDQEVKGSAYFVVIADGKCKLLDQKKVIIKAARPTNGIAEAKPAKFIDQSDAYFIKIGDQTAVWVKNNKSLLSIFGEKKAQIASFIKREKISAKEPGDLKRLVNFFNTL